MPLSACRAVHGRQGHSHPGHPGHHCPRYCHDRRTGYQHVAAASCLILCACHPAHTLKPHLLAHVLCCARVLLVGLLMPPLPEPTTEAELKKLKLKGRGSTAYPLGHKKNAEMDPKYKGICCNGTRVWGADDCRPYTFVSEKGAEFSVFCCGACRLPLPLPQLPPAAATPSAAVTSPVTLTAEQLANIEEKRQAALARKRAREEANAPPPPPPPAMSWDSCMGGHTKNLVRYGPNV